MLAVAKLEAGEGNVALAERAPRRVEHAEVRLEVRAAGVCGTDLHILAGEYSVTPPVTMGHEVCGVVVELGEGVDPSWLGRRVVSETFYSTCTRCAWCRAGSPNLCPERRSIGSHVDGAFAPSLVVPAANLHPVPDWLGDDAAPLAEPLACVVNALCDPSVVSAGDAVVVVGPGPVGLLAAQVARAGGAGSVVVVGTRRDVLRLETAEALGFPTALAEEEDALRGRLPAAGADVVIECSGAGPGISLGLRLARQGANVSQIGLAGRPVEIELDLICLKELSLSTAFASRPRSWARAMRLIEQRAVELTPLVTHRLPLARWEEAFALARRAEAVKVVFELGATAAAAPAEAPRVR